MKGEIDKVLKLLELEDMDVSVDRQRCTFPTAVYYPASKRTVIHANKPSLIRFALAHLILHEKAHDIYIASVEEEAEDHHEDPYFWEIFNELSIKLEDLIIAEHE